ncbi:MAG: WalW protein [Erythrobacter sp.]|nr:MAG: WalW protein [Erythrobacter sp.]
MAAIAPGEAARFAPGFGRRVLLTIDTEEEFDWSVPFAREATATSHTRAFAGFQAICEDIGAHPVWLVDWPIAHDPVAVEVLGEAARAGRADIGIHLHPWVNPPFAEAVNARNSYAGNLPPALEAEKFARLKGRVEEAFGVSPAIYRAGRYGFGPHTAGILKDHGIALDTSMRPLFDYRADGGPDYRAYPAHPWWMDAERSLLEVPVTSIHAGALAALGPRLAQLAGRVPGGPGLLARLRLSERIALTPEGVSVAEALRGIDAALAAGLPLIVLSFHSPSLAPGHTPYVRSEGDVAALHDWLRAIYARLDAAGVHSANVADILAAVRR